MDVTVIMGSESDSEVMRQSCCTLADLGVAYTVRVVSAHRDAEGMREFARRATGVVIAGAGGACHLPAMVKAFGPHLFVVAVQVWGRWAELPSGCPVAYAGSGKAGALNAALLAAEIVKRKP